jgi:hypothetical protein
MKGMIHFSLFLLTLGGKNCTIYSFLTQINVMKGNETEMIIRKSNIMFLKVKLARERK